MVQEIIFPEIKLFSILPLLIIILTSLSMLMLDLLVSKEKKNLLGLFGLFGLILAFLASMIKWNTQEILYSGALICDNFTIFFSCIFIIGGILTILMSLKYSEEERFNIGEYYILILFAISGMILMVSSLSLMVFFLGLEIMSISIYILTGILKKREKSIESAMKYFLMGAFSSAFLLYGIAFIYGATGSTNIFQIRDFLDTRGPAGGYFVIGIGLLLIGFGFKIASVPFHMWTPDVYEGAPTSVTAFMSVGVKASSFAALVRIFYTAFDGYSSAWVAVLWILAALTMIVGNLGALVQDNVKRMLAYSSIAHAGYILVAMTVGGTMGQRSILFYLLAYTFMNLGAFGILILLEKVREGNNEISNFKGLGFSNPVLGFLMSVFLFSLAGIPPTSGFLGKFYIFSSAINQGKPAFVVLAIIGVVNSVISVYYYLRVMVYMYMKPEDHESLAPRPVGFSMAFVLILAAIITIHMGLFPGQYLRTTMSSIIGS